LAKGVVVSVEAKHGKDIPTIYREARLDSQIVFRSMLHSFLAPVTT
jgi:hypothetical protein